MSQRNVLKKIAYELNDQYFYSEMKKHILYNQKVIDDVGMK